MKQTFKTLEGSEIIIEGDLSGLLSFTFEDGRTVLLSKNDIFSLHDFIVQQHLVEALEKEVKELVKRGDTKTLSIAIERLQNCKNKTLHG